MPPASGSPKDGRKKFFLLGLCLQLWYALLRRLPQWGGCMKKGAAVPADLVGIRMPVTAAPVQLKGKGGMKVKLANGKGQIFVPDGTPLEAALKRTTVLCIAAHQDDTEIMAYHAIAECFYSDSKWFTSLVVTDGAGSPRSGAYERYTDEEMRQIRAEEQKQAACIGRYAAQIQLGCTSSEVKSGGKAEITAAIKEIILACSPQVVYTHNLADKHDTHVAVALRTIAALRDIDPSLRPRKLYGTEVWRSLDWLCDDEKVVFDASACPNIAMALLGLFDSQVSGGKRYDLGALGRRRANAVFWESHSPGAMEAAIYAWI